MTIFIDFRHRRHHQHLCHCRSEFHSSRMKCDSRGQYSFVRRNEFPEVKSSHPIKPTMLTISHYPPNALAIAASDANDELSWSSLFCEF